MTRLASLMIVVALLCVPAHAKDGDPLVGRWRLDVANSTFSSGRPLLAEFLTIASTRAGLAIDLTTVDKRGRLRGLKSVAPLDASDGEVVILAPDDKTGTHTARVRVLPWINKMALQRLGPRSVRANFRKGDAVRFTAVATVDDMGSTLTWEQLGTDIDAAPFHDRLVFRRK